MASQTNPEESDLDRVARLIAELDGQESLLMGLEPSPSLVATPEIELAMAALRVQRILLEEERAEVGAKRCSQC